MSLMKEQPIKEQTHQMILKIVFTGKTYAGKTSLLTRQTTGQFSQNWIATIGVDFRIKTYRVGNIKVKTQLWDTAGQQRFRSIQKPYYRGAHAILLCFDLNDRKSFENLEQQISELKAHNLEGSQIYLIGCKSDLQPQVFTDEILIFSQRYQFSYFQTSAKLNEGVNECFDMIVRQCAQRKLEQMAFNSNSSKIQISAQNKQKPPGFIKKTCC